MGRSGAESGEERLLRSAACGCGELASPPLGNKSDTDGQDEARSAKSAWSGDVSPPRGNTAFSDEHGWTEEGRSGDPAPEAEARCGQGDSRGGDLAAKGEAGVEAEADDGRNFGDGVSGLCVYSEGGGEPAECGRESAEGDGEPPIGVGEQTGELRVSFALSS